MILAFKKHFKSKILEKSKKHTIRVDANSRWKKGRVIHFATGVRSSNYDNFAIGIVTEVKSITISYQFAQNPDFNPCVWVGETLLDSKQVLELALNDGFDSVEDFLLWFNEDFEGVLIYWKLDAEYDDYGNKQKCTCAKYNYPEILCPFDADIKDANTKCNCCEYCAIECERAI